MDNFRDYNSDFCSFEEDSIDKRVVDRRINDYDQFSAVYDEIMGNDMGKLLAKSYWPLFCGGGTFSMLDIGCGSGAFIRAASKYLPNVKFTGIDCSIGQIERAKSLSAEFRNINYYTSRAAYTTLPMNNVTTMNLDVINHFEAKDWPVIFKHICSSFDNYGMPNGLLLFDMNTQKRIIKDWNYPEVIIKPNMTYVQVGSSDIERKDGFVTRKLYMQVFKYDTPKKGVVKNLVQKLNGINPWRAEERPWETYENSKRYVVEVKQTAPTREKLFEMLKEAGFWRINELNPLPDHIFMKNRLFVMAQH